MRIALYARVSKALDQNPENQLIELRKWAVASKNEVVGEFIDEISSKDTRPQKEVILKMMRLGECDGVAFWSLDRWGRTASELIFELEEFSKTNKSLISLKEGIDLSTAAGRLMANMLAIMANFERDRIRERTLLGLARAKAQGKKLGRPWHKEKPEPNFEAVKELYVQGVTIREIAKKLGTSKYQVERCIIKYRKSTPPAILTKNEKGELV